MSQKSFFKVGVWTMTLFAVAVAAFFATNCLHSKAVAKDNTGEKIVSLSSRTEKLEAAVTQLSGRMENASNTIGDVIAESNAQKKRIDGHHSRLEILDRTVGNIGETAFKAKTTAETAVTRNNGRVQSENQAYKSMLELVRSANPTCDLAQKSDAEVEKLLNNGVWDIEPLIQAEYNRLMENTATAAQKTAIATAVRLDVVQQTANEAIGASNSAIGASNTALNGLGTIADSKTKLLSHSVSKKTKAEIAEQIKNYWRTQTREPVIKAGAPLE